MSLVIYQPILVPQRQFSRLNSFPTFKLDSCSPKFILLRKNSVFHPSGKYITRDSVKKRAVTGDEGTSLESVEERALADNESMNFSSGEIQAILNSLSKWLMAVVFGVFFLWRHDMKVLWATSGNVINVWLSTILKRLLNQERPISTLRSDPGMPSSHAQAIFYTVTFSILSMVEYFGLNGITAAISVLIFAMGSYFSWLRVSQQLHTLNQVTVGGVLGFSFSIFWFWLWDAVVLKAFTAHLWVRIIAILGGTGFCVGFLQHVIRNWFID